MVARISLLLVTLLHVSCGRSDVQGEMWWTGGGGAASSTSRAACAVADGHRGQPGLEDETCQELCAGYSGWPCGDAHPCDCKADGEQVHESRHLERICTAAEGQNDDLTDDLCHELCEDRGDGWPCGHGDPCQCGPAQLSCSVADGQEQDGLTEETCQQLCTDREDWPCGDGHPCECKPVCQNKTTDSFFEVFFDGNCLADGSVTTLPCPRDSAVVFWEKFAGPLRIDALYLNNVGLMLFVSFMMIGGVPKEAESWSGFFVATLWITAQMLQFVCIILSFTLLCWAYASMAYHFEPCLQTWQSSTPLLHVAAVPMFCWNPLVFSRFVLLAISVEASRLTAEGCFPRLACVIRWLSKTLAVLLRVCLLVQFVVFLVTLAPLFSITFVPISMLLGLLTGLTLYLLAWSLSYATEDSGNAKAWILPFNSDTIGLMRDRAMCLNKYDEISFDMLILPIPILVHWALICFVLCPTVCLGYFLAWNIYSGGHSATHVAHAYEHAFFLFVEFKVTLPTWTDVLEFDIIGALETLGDISVEFDPGDLIAASSALALLQTVLAGAKLALVGANALLTTLTAGNSGVPTESFKAVLLTHMIKSGACQLQDLSEEQRADRDTVLAAIREDSWAFQYASEALRADRKVVLAAVRKNGRALQYASVALRADSAFVQNPYFTGNRESGPAPATIGKPPTDGGLVV